MHGMYSSYMLVRANFMHRKCIQCTKKCPAQIVALCTCCAELCARYELLHGGINHNKMPVQIKYDRDRMLLSICMRDKNRTRRLLEIVKDKMLCHALMTQESTRIQCIHLLRAIANTKNAYADIYSYANRVYTATSVCCICSLDVNRWMCVTCGLVFCGKHKHETAGHAHAYEHYITAQHLIYIDMDRLDVCTGTTTAYCALCESFLHGTTVYSIVTMLCVFVPGCVQCNPEQKSTEVWCSECVVYRDMQSRRACTQKCDDSSTDTTYMLSVLLALSYCTMRHFLHV